MISGSALLKTLRGELSAAGNSKKAPAMQASMNSQMPFLKVPASAPRALTRRTL